MSGYEFEGSSCSWKFCRTCGCHIVAVEHSDSSWVISTSIFTDQQLGNFQIKKHNYTKSTGDGGLADILTHVANHELENLNPPDWIVDRSLEDVPEFDDTGAERLRAQCHCGGVSFTFGRPTEEHIKDEYLVNYVSPLDKSKWLACLDVCDDCRLVNGTHLVGWTFLPLVSCNPPIKSDLKIGTMKTYSTSPGVLRSFCGSCGATFFFSCDERHPSDEKQVVDLATGVLRAPEGSMAENWLTWRTKISWLDSGKRFDEGFSGSLQEGMRRWTVQRHGRELNISID